jgi:hypothetical protein
LHGKKHSVGGLRTAMLKEALSTFGLTHDLAVLAIATALVVAIAARCIPGWPSSRQ